MRKRAQRGRATARRRVTAAAAVIAVAGGGGTAWAMTSGSGASYRTSTVTRQSIEQSIELTGVLSAVTSADLDFQVSGTVAKVIAKQDHKVSAGETLAVLDRTPLRQTLTAAERTLAQARTTLADDETGETSTATTTSADATSTSGGATLESASEVVKTARTPTPTSTSSPASNGTGTATTGIAAQLRVDQAAVVAAQHTADLALAAAQAALTAEESACSAETTTTSTTTSGAASTGAASDDSDTAVCTQAATTLLADQQKVSADLVAVQTANAALDTALTAELKKAGSASGTTSGSATHAGSSDSTSTSTPTGTTSPSVTAATLDSAEAVIDTDWAAVLSAAAALSQARLTSPISGRVIDVTIAKGDTVASSSGSTSSEIEIVGSGQDEVTVDASATQVRQLSVGMSAAVIPDGATSALPGSIVAISLAGTESTTTGSVSYPVTIRLTRRATSLASGADATVTLDVAHVDDVLAVPTSAVHYAGKRAYVQLLESGTVVNRTITVAARGASYTQVRSGLTLGERVVLANLNAAVPSSSTTIATITQGAHPTGGGFGGGPGSATGGPARDAG